MTTTTYDRSQLYELLYQALETEMGGALIYEAAIACATNDDLREEWETYLDQTHTHKDVLLVLFDDIGLDPMTETPGRTVVAHIGASLVKAIKLAQSEGDAAAAQLVAGECVVLAETKDHLNWELIGHVATHGNGPETEALKAAHEAVEQEEHHHLFHTAGWTRELWIDALGLPAVLPPPEEVKKVETAIGAARAEHAREDLL